MITTIFSWNVNGFRAVARNGFFDWLNAAKPDILCLQETKCRANDLSRDLLEPQGYASIWHHAQKAGYSGTAIFFKRKKEPREVTSSGVMEFDQEGRIQIAHFTSYVVINAYFPNSQPERKRLAYKLAFNEYIRTTAARFVKDGNNVVICGDFNVAHTELDLARPEENRNNPGFYPEECASMQALMDEGFIDTFRAFHPGEKGWYTWWSYRTRARERNIGWRLDYHIVNSTFFKNVIDSKIWADVHGSDHCPVSIALR